MEVGRRVEVLVHAGEPQVGHLVERAQLVEHGEPTLALDTSEPCRRAESSTRQASASSCSAVTERPVVAAASPAISFLRSNGSRPPCDLTTVSCGVVDPLERGEPVSTRQALPATADGRRLLGDPGVDDLRVVGMTHGALHTRTIARPPVHQRATAGRRQAASWQPHGLPDGDVRAAVEIDQGIDVAIDRHVAVVGLGDRPQRIARRGHVDRRRRRVMLARPGRRRQVAPREPASRTMIPTSTAAASRATASAPPGAARSSVAGRCRDRPAGRDSDRPGHRRKGLDR